MTNSRDLANLGGGFIQAGGGVQRSVESKLKDVVSVKDFGAVGDAVISEVAFNSTTHYDGNTSNYPYKIHQYVSGTDNKTAFINAFAALEDGDSLYIPSGTYYISQGAAETAIITVSSKKNITIYGDGASSIIYSYVNTNGAGFNFCQFLACTGVTIRDLAFDIQGIGYHNYDSIGSLTRIKALSFYPEGGATEYSAVATPILRPTSKNCRVKDCQFRITHPGGAYPGSGGTSGLAGGTKVEGILFYGDYQPVTTVGAEPAATLTLVQDCILNNCIFKESQGRLVWAWMTSGVTISNNQFYSCGGEKPAIRCLHYNRNLVVENNILYAEDDWDSGGNTHVAPIAVVDNNGKYVSPGVRIVDNHVTTQTGAGISISGTNSCIVSDNTVVLEKGYTPSSSSFVYSGIIGQFQDISVDETGINTNLTVTGNSLDNKGLFLQNISGGLVADNVIRASDVFTTSASAVLQISPYSDVNIIGNKITHYNSGGIFINAGADYPGNVLVSGNVLTRTNPSQGTTDRGIGFAFAGSRNDVIISNNLASNYYVGFRDDDTKVVLIDNIGFGNTSNTNSGFALEDSYGVVGAAVERGGTANDGYVKYRDGTLVCYFRSVSTVTIGATSNHNEQWVFPHTFSDTPIVTGLAALSTNSFTRSASVSVGLNNQDAEASAGNLTTRANLMYRNNDSGSGNFYIQAVAIGRWF